MNDQRLTQLAEILVRKCIDTKPMEKVWIRTTDPAGLPLLKEVYKQVVLAGALPTMDVGVEGLGSWFLANASKKQVDVPPDVMEFQAKRCDKSVMIVADVDKSDLIHANPDFLRLREKLSYPVRQIIMSKPWVLTEFPTAAMAQLAHLNLEELENFFFLATIQDWAKIETEMRLLAKKLNGAELHLVGENTDLRISTKGRVWIADDWKANMPGGEVFTSPIETKVEGHVYFNYPLMRQGKMMRDIHLWFEKGKVVKATASENEVFLHHILDTDEGSRRLGECADTSFSLAVALTTFPFTNHK